tara:strand:+ start:2125 stop:2811 length:687 start_codon:yes stop_codon:yes gene_type:complete
LSIILNSKKNNFLKFILQRANVLKSLEVIKEKIYGYDKTLYEKINDNSVLIGYWQDEKYFSLIKEKIRTEIQLVDSNTQFIKKYKKAIIECNSVSVHFRMKDYIENKKTSDFHGVLSNEYYKKSFELVSKRIENPTFFVFSDDINKVKDRLDMNYSHHFIFHQKPIKDTDELFLMSLCKHNIIANSTYSWWGGWLNKNKNKIVIGPKNWFKSKENKKNNPMPKEWIRI